MEGINMAATIEIRCPGKRHLLGIITAHGDRYLFQPHEVLVETRKSDDGDWYGVQRHARPTTGLPTYDLQEEAEDNWQVVMECKCGRRMAPVVTIYEKVLSGDSEISLDVPIMR